MPDVRRATLTIQNDDELLLTVGPGTVADLKSILTSITTGQTRLLIRGDGWTEEAGRQLLDLLKTDDLKHVTLEVNLPASFLNSRTQVELDNLISDRRLEQRDQERVDVPPALHMPVIAEARVLPKGKITPQIEIVLSEAIVSDYALESTSANTTVFDETRVLADRSGWPTLCRSPMAASIVRQIRSEDDVARWEEMTIRDEASAFRLEIPALPGESLDAHPLCLLLAGDDSLKEQLQTWTDTLQLGKEQYDALLDVCGQYGVQGVRRLFHLWNFNGDSNKKDVFKAMHADLLKYMPTYLPFLENDAFNETLSAIVLLTPAKRSVWNALIKNHGETEGYSDLPSLFQSFRHFCSAIDAMRLNFSPIETIKDIGSLPATLSGMLSLLKRCPASDRAVQLACLNEAEVSKYPDFHFIIPEMRLGKDNPTMEALKQILKHGEDIDPGICKAVFYRYLATQNQHLPIEQYRTILNGLFSNQVLNDPVRLRMVYILAKTTSIDTDVRFDADSILAEWKSFEDRTVKLEYMERIKANRDNRFSRAAFTGGIEARGGYQEVRMRVLSPIMDMSVIPPISYLNKLFKLSEYKFLDPELSIIQMEVVQVQMMVDMNKAAELYDRYPESMMQAIRLIHTATVSEKQGKFFPDPVDISLLDKFVRASETLTDQQYNQQADAKDNPIHVLLPLLTVFHLEYAENARLIDVIQTYNDNLTSVADHKPLFLYGLSLLQWIKDRERPAFLTWEALNMIQTGLLTLIAREEPTTKKDIREWMHSHYGAHFERTVLLDIREEVNFDALFDELGCPQGETREAITHLVSHFDRADEKDQQEALLKSLVRVALTEDLSLSQRKRFFDYCVEAVKTERLFSREKQSTPPSYIAQLTEVIDAINDLRSIDEFERYMEIVQERHLSDRDIRDSLRKCTYLLSTLYPALVVQGVTRRAAINFSAELVCCTPLAGLNAIQAEARLDYEEEEGYPTELRDLAAAIGGFQQRTIKTKDHLTTLKEEIHKIVLLANDNPDVFQDCQRVSQQLTAIIQAIDGRTAARATMGMIQRFRSGDDTHAATEAELNGLYTELKGLICPNAATHRDIKLIHHQQRLQAQHFQDLVLHLYEKKSKLIAKYSHISTRIDDFIGKALLVSPAEVSKNYNDVCQLIDCLIELDEPNLVLSLMYHYAGGLPDRHVKDLIEIFSQDAYQGLTTALKKDVMKAIVAQMNNCVSCSKVEINQFIQYVFANKENAATVQCLHDDYQHAPFPPLPTFIGWMQLETDARQSAYDTFDKNPCALGMCDGREQDNGFKRSEAETILKQMSGVGALFTLDYLTQIQEQEAAARQLSTQAILEKLKAYKDSPPPENAVEMVMLTIELLHRCKGRTPLFVDDTQVSGRSFELNTTQIIAILTMLETGRKVTAEIGTGEGKSRIMMVMNACQFLKGNTVDFVTSNLALAERDYLESLTFLNSLGAEVAFITASSTIDDYKIGGINVSDPSNLCLFRNKAVSQKEARRVFDPVPEKRALLLDEADVTYFDVSHLNYSYSSTIPKKSMDMLPLYPLLMDFFAEEGNEQTYLENKRGFNEQLFAFIQSKDPALASIIKSMPIEAFEQYQDAAYTARHLNYNENYVILSDTTATTAMGDKKVAAAVCRLGSRLNPHAVFPKGVHQCLHAELNRLMKMPSFPTTINPYLNVALARCKIKNHVFNIEPERQSTFSSSSITMLNAYKKGCIHAVSGTVGMEMEKQEASTDLGTVFVHLPRHKGLHRIDRPTRITEDPEKHLDLLVTHILEARAKQQPVLLICKDDSESADLYAALEQRLNAGRLSNGLPKLTRIHAASNEEDHFSESTYIKEEAGKPGRVTITTDMEGRGTDIELHGTASQAGLKVLLTYLPEGERDYRQIVGRSGRYGAIGESQMVLSLESLRRDFGINHLNMDFYLNPEAFIRQLQLFSTHTKTLHRLFDKTFNAFFANILEQYEHLDIRNRPVMEAWGHFFEQCQQSKERAQNVIRQQLQQPSPDSGVIEMALADHQKEVEMLWTRFTDHLSGDASTRAQGVKFFPIKVPRLLKHWLDEMKILKGEATVSVKERHRVHVADTFDPTSVGRMSILKNPGWIKTEGREWFANFRAWRRGEGILFPNVRAWWAGEISFRNLLSQLPIPIVRSLIKPKDEIREVQKTVSSTYATLYKAFPISSDTETADEIEDAASEQDLVSIEGVPPSLGDASSETPTEGGIDNASVRSSDFKP